MRILTLLFLFLLTFQSEACHFKAGIREFPPYSYLDKSNQWQGYDVQVLTQLVLSVNCQITYLKMPFGEALKMLRAGQIDILMHLSNSGDRSTDIAFIGPIREQFISLITSKKVSGPINTIDDITHLPFTFGHRQGIFIGEEFDNKRQQLVQFAKKFVEVKQASNLMTMIERKRIDGFFEDHHYNKFLLENDPAGESMVEQPLQFSIGEVYIGVSKKSVSSFHQKVLKDALDNIELPY